PGRGVAELRGRGPAARRGAGAEEGAAGRAAVLTRGAGAALVGLGGRWEDVAMAKTWSSVTVELLGGGGYDLWPWPGRGFAVVPSHTFAQLADAIDVASACWDRAHLSIFTLPDGRVVTDSELGDTPVLLA